MHVLVHKKPSQQQHELSVFIQLILPANNGTLVNCFIWRIAYLVHVESFLKLFCTQNTSGCAHRGHVHALYRSTHVYVHTKYLVYTLHVTPYRVLHNYRAEYLMNELPSTRRTHLSTTNHKSFVEAGGNLIKAKFHCNVIRPAILQFPINDVCTPVLHLDLGIFAWLYEAMMKDVLELDELLGKLLMQANQSDSEVCVSQKHLHDCQALRSTAVGKCNCVKYQLDYVVFHAQRSGLTVHLQALAGTLQLQWTELSKEVEECIKSEEAKRKAVKALEKKIWSLPYFS